MTAKPRLAAAFRARAAVIGALSACTCEYPAKRYDTDSFHARDCQAHAITLSMTNVAGTDYDRYLPVTWRKL